MFGAVNDVDEAVSALQPQRVAQTGQSLAWPAVADPPIQDVEITACRIGEFGMPTADLEITNHSSKASDYFVQVEFVSDGDRIDEGSASATAVRPGQTAKVEAPGFQMGVTGTVTCRVLTVDRYSSVG